ncbi:GPN-loop GTPase 3, partial [Armadillidium vulgare]
GWASSSNSLKVFKKCIFFPPLTSVINLDPAAEQFQYKALADMRDLVQVSDVMEAEDLNYGPNGGLVFCMEYLMEVEGIEWLQEQLGDEDDDYILFDCPGQIELYTHMDIMKRFAKQLEEWNFRLPQINVLSKMDLLSKQAKQNLEMYLEPEVHELLASEHSISRFNKKYHKLTAALGQVLDEYSLVKFIPLNINKLESISDLLLQIDFSIQYGEDLDIKTTDYDYPDPDEEDQSNYVPMDL